MRFLVLLICLSFSGILSHGQNINGTLMDANNEPINYANITLYKGEKWIDGVISENGKFIFKDIAQGTYKLCASYIGYKDTCLQMNVSSKETNIAIVLNQIDTELEEVIISEKRPEITMIDHKIVMNVNNTLLSQKSLIEDVLKHIPGIIKTKNGFEVFGKGKPLFLINGKEVLNFSEVEALSPEYIKSIEVSDAGAKYDASVHKVINIITKKNIYSGLKIYERVIINDKKANNTARIWATYKKNKWQHSLFYDGFFGKIPFEEKAKTKVFLNQNKNYISDVNMNVNDMSRDNYLSYNLGYDIDSNQNIGINLSGSFGKPDTYAKIQSIINNKEKYKTELLEDKQYYDFQSSAFYNLETKKEHKFSLDLEYFYSKNKTNNNTLTNGISNLLNSENDYQIYAINADYTIPVKIIKSELNVGTKVYKTINNNTSKATNNEFFNQKNKLTENTPAVYLSLNSNLSEKIKLKAGLRYEYYNKSIDDDIKKTRSHHYFFPDIAISYVPIPFLGIMAGYSKKINRQAYNYISGQNIYINPYMYKTGNPYLKPEIIDSYSLQLVLFGAINLQGSFLDRKNYTTMAFSNNDSTVIIGYKNYHKQDLNAGLSISTGNDIYYVSLGANINKPFFQYSYLDNKKKNKMINFDFSLNVYYSITDYLEPQVGIYYNPKTEYDAFVFEPKLTAYVGLAYFTPNNNLRISAYYQYKNTENYYLEYALLNMSHSLKKIQHEITFSILFKLNFKHWEDKEYRIQDELDRIE